MKKLMFKLVVLCTAVLGTPLLASAAPAVAGTVTIIGNKAGDINTTGGRLSVGKSIFKFGELDMSAGANVNSVVVTGGSIQGSVIVKDNEVGNVTATGGMVNVNSLVVSAK